MPLLVTEAALWRGAERLRQWQLGRPPERTVADAETAVAGDSGGDMARRRAAVTAAAAAPTGLWLSVPAVVGIAASSCQ